MKSFKQLSTPVRYNMIGEASVNSGLSVQQLSKIFNITQTTVRTAIKYHQNPLETSPMGRPKLLRDHHLRFIEAKTISNRSMSCSELVRELKEHFQDLEKTKLN